MDVYESAVNLLELIQNTKVVYLHTDPEVIDFTNHGEGTIVLVGGKKRIEIALSRDNVNSVMGQLAFVFDKEYISTVLTWNLKPLLTYFKAYCPKPLEISNSVLDLHVLSNFLGIHKTKPLGLLDAVALSKEIAKSNVWKPVYQAIHKPLMMRVLPALENTPLLDESDRTSKYSYYEIEGQTNGRLRCVKMWDRGYIPHTLGPDQKAALKPKGYGYCFMSTDIRHCEVAVLQWLADDPVLKRIIDSGEDIYKEIYRLITNDACDTDKKRDLGKKMFLPVMYGCGSGRLSEIMQVRQEVAKELIQRIHSVFSVSHQWITDRQEEAKANETIVDYFGRPRTFKEEFYKARNFVVQGVAATACLEKLIQIHDILQPTQAKLCFSIHDGYGILCPIKDSKSIYYTVKRVIEEESKICPGLVLRQESKFGKRLDNMKVYWK
jgi:hypothetical protein